MQSLKKKRWTILSIHLLNFFDRKKAENLGKKSPKIQGGVHQDHFRKLSSPVDSASSDTTIAPLDPLGAEKLGGQNLNFDETFVQNGGSPTQKFWIIKNLPWRPTNAGSMPFLNPEIKK